MSEIWDKPITDTTDWGGDSSTGGLPVSGRQVQAWLKSRIAKILTEAQITKIIEDWVQKNGFADDEGFVTLSSDQEINGLKNFLQGLMVNGGLVKYDPELKVWQLNGNLLVTGGISMYSNLEGFKPSTIMDGILTDEVTITVKDGRLTVLAAESGLNYDELDAYLKKYEYTTISEVDARISELVNGAPQAYDTLKEIADVLQGNVNSIGDILATLAKKANTTYVDGAIADTKTWVEEQQYINEIDPSYIEAALGYQPYDGDTNRKEFTSKTYVSENFMSLATGQDVSALHNFLNGFNIAGIPFRKMANGSLFIDANVVFGGGATIYGTDKTPAPSIFDGLPIDGRTIKRDGNGALYVDETALSVSGGGGVADSVAWANVYGKPTDIEGYGLVEYLTNLNNATLDKFFRSSFQASNRPAYNYAVGFTLGNGSASANYAAQLAIDYYGGVHTRYKTSTEWSEWVELAPLSSIPSLAGYATETFVNTALAGYLPLSGGVIAGSLRVGADDNSRYNFISTVRLNHAAVISNTDEGAFFSFSSYSDGVLSTKKMIDLGIYDFRYSNDGGKTFNKILHAGNYSDYALPLSGGTVNGILSVASVLRMSDLDGTYKVILQRDSSGNILFGGGFATNNMYIDADVLRIRANNTIFSTANIGTLQIVTNEVNGANGTGNAHINYSSTGKVTIANGGGNVAIGGTTADEKLHVHGNTQITGNLIFDAERQTLISRKLNSTGQTAIFAQVNSEDILLIGQGIARAGKNTYIYGNEMNFCYGTAGSTSSTAMHIYSNGDVAMERLYLYPQTQALNASSGVLRFYSIRDTISGPSIQGVHALQGYGAKHLVFYQHNTGGYTEYEAMRLTYDGNLVIGGTTANAKLHVYGNLLTEGGVTMYSQRSLKNILSYDGLSLEQLSVIRPIKFTWKDGRDNRYHVGGVADDVETVVPEVVYSTNDFLTMDYGNAGFYVAASLIKPVIDHETRIKQLEYRVKELENENKQLRQSA